MMKYFAAPLALLLTLTFSFSSAQVRPKPRQDKGAYQVFPPSYYNRTIMPSLEGKAKGGEPYTSFKVNLDDRKLPTDPAEYEKVWHGNPISQGNTGTCWCFSTVSFYESEVKRLSGKEVRLSEIYTVYWEYVERARYFVQNRGDMYFGEGSETNAVARMMNMYGVVPHEVYDGLPGTQPFHNHEPMFEELEKYLESVKTDNAWDEEQVVATTKSILNHYLGEPPAEFSYQGEEYTPKSFMENHLSLKPDEYVDFMSLMEHPYWKQAEYKVPDNWWHSDVYYNLPLDVFMGAMKKSLQKGYSFAIGGDVSEAGLVSYQGVAVVPTFDIPSEYINESARQLRFNNGSTTDDHAMHVVGYREFEGDTWFLVKDSGSGSRHCGEQCEGFGYYFFHEDYVKLKMMNFTVHRDAVKDLMDRLEES